MCFGVFGLLYSLNTSLFIYAFCNYNVLFKSQWDALIPELRERIKYSSVEQTKRSVLTKKHYPQICAYASVSFIGLCFYMYGKMQ